MYILTPTAIRCWRFTLTNEVTKMNEEVREKAEAMADTLVEALKDEPQDEPFVVEVEPEQEEQLSTLINEVKQQYETKLTEMVAKKDREIAERDNVIKQLIDQEDKTAVFEKSIADKINEKRNYKKW